MPHVLRGLLGAAVAVAALVPATAANAGEAHRTLPEHVFSPYFQSYTDASPAAVSRASGARYLTMAFLQTQAAGSCDVLWNGDPAKPVAWSTFGPDIARIRATGGDVVPSFGGYSADSTATEIADSCTDVPRIAAAYQKVIATYGVTRLDMDIEDQSLNDLAAIDRRNQAIHLVQQWAARQHRPLQIVYTLPTTPHGLEPNAVNVLRSAQRYGARVDIVNIMTFDYYDDQPHDMAADTKSAARGLLDTLRQLYPHRSTADLWRMVGVTEMLGIDDYGSGGETGPLEILTLAGARDVTRWAAEHHIGELSFWALGRDNGGCPGVAGSDDCSGVAQAPYQYTHIMQAFAG
ncbi:chitinase [Dactylosporangium salmoneum]|uniref:GH18 domain-containing protein n=1 Tax=Dactylosporangium salmoneum TaxID=53361 RepID=A0ABN3FRF8_9ACTN